MSPTRSAETLADRAVIAAVAPRQQTERFFADRAKEVPLALARNPNLQERHLLRLLERKDLAPEVLREIAAHKEAVSSYRVKLALVRHPGTPRLVSLPILKFLHLFDLVRVCQTPAVPTDIKVMAEETTLRKAERIPRGEKINLARRGSGRVAAGLLRTRDRAVIQAILDNPYLTEAQVLRVLPREGLAPEVLDALTTHEKWVRHYQVRLGLIRNPLTPFHRVLGFLPDLAVNDLREICLDRRMPEQVRAYIEAYCAARLRAKPRGRPCGG